MAVTGTSFSGGTNSSDWADVDAREKFVFLIECAMCGPSGEDMLNVCIVG